jgi:transposase
VGQLELPDHGVDETPIASSREGLDHEVRGTEGVTRLIEQEDNQSREVKEATMSIDFLNEAKKALRSLQRAQHQRERHESLVGGRFDEARAAYHREMARAAALEAQAWVRLMNVPGMSVRTAATLGGASVATVHRRLKEARDV